MNQLKTIDRFQFYQCCLKSLGTPEKAVYSQFYSFLEENKLLRDFQFGFRKKRSKKLATTLRCDQIRNHMDKGRMVGCVYLDLSKAFDTISHSSESLNQKIGTGADKLEHPLYN